MTLWIFLGVILGVSFYFFATNDMNIKFTWYEWVMVVLSVILVMFTIQNYQASQMEIESRAAGYFLLIFGLPGVILGVLPVVLCWLRYRKATA